MLDGQLFNNSTPTMESGFISKGQLYKQKYQWVTNSRQWSVKGLLPNQSAKDNSFYEINKFQNLLNHEWGSMWLGKYLRAIIGEPRATTYIDKESLLEDGFKGVYMPYGTPEIIYPKSLPYYVAIGTEIFAFYMKGTSGWNWGELVEDETMHPESVPVKYQETIVQQSFKVNFDIMHDLICFYSCKNQGCLSQKPIQIIFEHIDSQNKNF